MVYVYALNIEKLKDPQEYPDILESLPEYRKKRIEAFRNAKGKAESFGAGLLLKRVCEQHGISDESVSFGQHGKPEIRGFYFNLSHSENMILCAVSEKRIGCDIEKIDISPARLVKRFFNKNEISYLQKFDKTRNEEFYRLWTMKEAYVKMTGEGLTCPLSQFEIRIDDKIKVYRNQKAEKCHIKEYDVPGYKVSICAEEEQFCDDIMYMEL